MERNVPTSDRITFRVPLYHSWVPLLRGYHVITYLCQSLNKPSNTQTEQRTFEFQAEST